MQNKNILKLHNKYHNVVDLHNAKPILGKEEKVVDLRIRERVFNKDAFEQTLRSSVTAQSTHHRAIRRPVKINLVGLVSKSIALLLLVSLNSFAISQVGNTFSVFGDTESSQNNSFISGVLDFEMTVSPFNNDAWTNLIPGTTTAQDIDVVPNIVSNPFVYFASSTNFTGDDNFCNVVHVVATLDGEVMYDGLLKDMLTGTTTNLTAWNFEFSTDTSFFNSMCHFDIDWNGWQTRHDYPNYHDGYSDTETTTHWLFADGLKINKVYFEKPDREIPHCRCDHPDHGEYGEDGEYHCEGYEPNVNVNNENVSEITTEITDSTNSNGGDGEEASSSSEVENTENVNIYTDEWIIEDHEWVELYNPNNEFADINGWFICDGQSCDELVTTEPIPPFGYAIIYADEQVLTDWVVPDDFVTILIEDGQIGDGLDNENDGLTLLRPDFHLFDHVNWGTPDVLWPYYDPLFWNPGVTPPSLGNMIARVPTGNDTNTTDDWFELARPGVELLYPGAVVFEPWFWDYTYLVTWNATNTNGADEDLTADIYLIQDTNYTYRIDDGDEHILIANDIPNDGNEEVTVPEGFIGMIWLKIVVTGPENPMVQAKTLSGFMFSLWPPHAQDDEDSQEMIQQAVTTEMMMTGESEYSHLLPEPYVPEESETTSDEETKDTIRDERRDRNDREGEEDTTSAETEENVTQQEDGEEVTTEEGEVLEEVTTEEESIESLDIAEETTTVEADAFDTNAEDTTEQLEEPIVEETTEEVAEPEGEVSNKIEEVAETEDTNEPTAEESSLPVTKEETTFSEETGFREEITELINEASTQEEMESEVETSDTGGQEQEEEQVAPIDEAIIEEIEVLPEETI